MLGVLLSSRYVVVGGRVLGYAVGGYGCIVGMVCRG